MKRLLLLPILILLLFTFKSNAQERKFHIGPTVGAGSGTFTNTNSDTKNWYSTFRLGIQTDYRFRPDMSLGLDIYYTRFGAENDYERAYMYNDYINIPVYIRYFIASTGFNVQIGPEIGILAKSEVNEDTADYIWKDFNLSADLGVGYLFENGINIDIRYNPGLVNVSKVANVKTKLMTLSIGYWF